MSRRPRPSGALHVVTLAVVWGFVVWVSRRLLLGRTGYFTWFAIAFVAIWEGAKLIPTLVNGFVLAATPAFLTRAACVVCLACGIGLLVVASTLIGEPDPDEAAESEEYDDELSWESLAYSEVRCGTSDPGAAHRSAWTRCADERRHVDASTASAWPPAPGSSFRSHVRNSADDRERTMSPVGGARVVSATARGCVGTAATAPSR